jgi:hypothetical protein
MRPALPFPEPVNRDGLPTLGTASGLQVCNASRFTSSGASKLGRFTYFGTASGLQVRNLFSYARQKGMIVRLSESLLSYKRLTPSTPSPPQRLICHDRTSPPRSE